LPELFRLKRAIPDDPETNGYLEQNLLNPLSQIVTSKAPLLTAAQVNTQVEFDRTCRTLVTAEGYRGKQVILISGLNVDISPKGQATLSLGSFRETEEWKRSSFRTERTLQRIAESEGGQF